MGLKDVFTETAEKVEEEKKLEIVISESSIVNDFILYFEERLPRTELIFFDDMKLFKAYKQYSGGFIITPSLITKVDLALPKNRQGLELHNYLNCKGLLLSAMTQISYNQGFNCFNFEKIDAHNFGGYLIGKQNKPIVIKIGKLVGDFIFEEAKNVVAEIQKYRGYYFAFEAENVKIYSPNQQTLRRLKKGWLSELGVEFILNRITNEELEKWA